MLCSVCWTNFSFLSASGTSAGGGGGDAEEECMCSESDWSVRVRVCGRACTHVCGVCVSSPVCTCVCRCLCKSVWTLEVDAFSYSLSTYVMRQNLSLEPRASLLCWSSVSWDDRWATMTAQHLHYIRSEFWSPHLYNCFTHWAKYLAKIFIFCGIKILYFICIFNF